MSPEKRARSLSDASPMTCPECQGRGWMDNRCLAPGQEHRCHACNGRGTTLTGKLCRACHGSGMMEIRAEDKSPCVLCKGAGVYPVPESMTISDFAYHPRRRKK